MQKLFDMHNKKQNSKIPRERLPSLHLFTDEHSVAGPFQDLEFLILVKRLKDGSYLDQLRLRRLIEP